MAKTLPPRFVRSAKMYVVTELLGEVALKNKTKQLQEQKWFGSDEEKSAWEFYKSKI